MTSDPYHVFTTLLSLIRVRFTEGFDVSVIHVQYLAIRIHDSQFVITQTARYMFHGSHSVNPRDKLILHPEICSTIASKGHTLTQLGVLVFSSISINTLITYYNNIIP